MKADTTVISVKVDRQVKEQAQEVAKSAGFNLSSLINSYLRQLSATRRIELYVPEQANPALEKVIAGIEADIQAGKVSRPFHDAEEFLADLKS
jgi:addiction module RelB/DinJ family antitoxin